MMKGILDGLNESQIAAATHLEGPQLILAGAGSGKTKTITTRLAYLIGSVGIAPESTLTLTFTNRAALEMKERALRLLAKSVAIPPLLCTFHSFGKMFLSFHIRNLGRSAAFQIIDTDDQKRIVKKINQDSRLESAEILNAISRFKNAATLPEAAKKAEHFSEKAHLLAEIYAAYHAYLLDNNLVDFDDLLLLPYLILDANAALRTEMSQKYRYLMVDEYQDTNDLQDRILRQLCATHENLCVVGDDDQSIYSWRGARLENILNFDKHFSGVKVVRLEQNYRSTSEILSAANSLIAANKTRLGKVLQSVRGGGEKIEVLASSDERFEALAIGRRIRALLDSGTSPSEIAVLFRVKALSRSLEEAFAKLEIPFKIIGAAAFYERSEIKDILSYFRLVVDKNDDFSLSRVINRPKRGIGKATQEKLEAFAKKKGVSIAATIENHADSLDISAKNLAALRELFLLLDSLKLAADSSLEAFLEQFVQKINIAESYKGVQEDIDRAANVSEFYGVFKHYFLENPTASLSDFLNDIALMSVPTKSDSEAAVSCMSVHSAKGLEFEHLFIIGLEEGFFPVTGHSVNMEEERRLCYVALTRAKSHCAVSFVKSRYYKNERTMLRKSRFLAEAGLARGESSGESGAQDSQDSVDLADSRGAKNSPDSPDSRDFYESRGVNPPFKKGDLISHKIFGFGRVRSVEKSGAGDCLLGIDFGGTERKILGSFVAKVEP